MWSVRANILAWFARGLFYSGTLVLLNFIVNRFGMRWSRQANGKRNIPFIFIRKRLQRNFQILIYHQVNNERDPFLPGTPVKVFEKQMAYLSERFSVMPLEEILEKARRDGLPENALAVTFDDGYRDNYENAFPILKKYSLPATIFLATGGIGSSEVLWHDLVASAFRRTDCSDLAWEEGKYPLKTIEERVSSFERVMQSLREMENSERLSRLGMLLECLNVSESGQADLMLTWDQIEEMHCHGISFGAHTVTHPILSRLTPASAEEEILRSKETIESVLHVPVRVFAYPNGRCFDYNDEVKAILKKGRFFGAVTTIRGANTAMTDPFELRRGTPWDADLPLFAIRLTWYQFSS